MTTWFDTETRSPVPIKDGTDRYTAAAECLLLSFARDDHPAQLWDVIGGEPAPKDWRDALEDPNEPLIAHNAPFDRAVLRRCLGIRLPITRFACTRAQAYAHGYPGALETLGEILQLAPDQQKLVDDKKLINLFCIPYGYYPDGTPKYYDRTTHPAEWQRFCGYALRDTEALRAIHRKLPAVNYQGTNLATWQLGELINERGFGLDVRLARAARDLLAKAKVTNDADIDGRTNGAVQAATQRARLLAWLEGSGLALPNLKAATIREWLDHDDLRPEHRFILELRLEASQSSGAKYRRGLEMVGAGDRIRNAIQFSGAGRTGRFSGKGFQPHNMPRPTTKANYIAEVLIPGILSGEALKWPLIYGGPNEACKNSLRGAICAAPGNELVVADWSNIEGRINAWLAAEEWKLAAYRAQDAGEGVDGYRLLYSKFFGIPLEEVDDHQRQVGKVVDLSCGYLASVGAFVTMAAGYGIDLDELPDLVLPSATADQRKKSERAWRRALLKGEEFGLKPDTFMACHVLVQVYRAANAAIFENGHELGRVCIEAVENPGMSFRRSRCTIWSTSSFLIIELPSKRRLLYAQPKIGYEKDTDPETGKVSQRKYVSYLTARGKGWVRERAWAGLFLENVDQAIANDILRAGLRIVHRDTLSIPEIANYLTLVEDAETAISMHVHDEIVCDVPKGSYPKDRLVHCMTTQLLDETPWCAGLPLAASGWVGPRFRK